MGTKKATQERIKAARNKFKTHVRCRGEHTDFEVTETFCLYWWRRLNEIVFDSKLTQPVRFEIKKFRTASGWCKPWRPNAKVRRVTIGIDSQIWERRHFLCVLSHEMVHQWEWEATGEWAPSLAHGDQFFSWRPKLIERVGLPLEISY